MDKNTQRKLHRIGASIPQKLTQNLTKVVVDRSEEELAHAALDSKHISSRKKEVIRKKLNEGAFARLEEVENEAVIKQIDEHNSREVKRLRDAGELPDLNDDPYVRERNYRAAHRGDKPAAYSSFLKSSKNALHIQPLGNKVLVQEILEEKKQSFIIVPEKENRHAYRRGMVFMVGPKVDTVKPGMTVIFDLYQFETIEREGEAFLVGSEDAVTGIISNE